MQRRPPRTTRTETLLPLPPLCRYAYAPQKRLSGSCLRVYIAGILVNTFEGTRFEPINGIDIEAYDVRLSPRAQAEFGHFRYLKARRYPSRFSRDAASGVNAVFGRNPDPLRHRNLERS